MRLGGTLFIRNGIEQDYHFVETIECMKDFADEIVICDAGSTDGTDEVLRTLEDRKTKVIYCTPEMWEEQKSQQKLSYFTNIAINALTTPWNFNLQGDEVLHESSFAAVRQAMEDGNDAYICKRVNLWGNSQHYLSVTPDRLPVGDYVIRLAKTHLQSMGDAQSLDGAWIDKFAEDIRIYHTGFVRDKRKHMVKIENMMCNVFGWGMDEKLKSMGGEFDPFVHFSLGDIKPITEPLPEYIQEWAKSRDEMNGIII